jgi:hypothetical protein
MGSFPYEQLEWNALFLILERDPLKGEDHEKCHYSG